MREGQDQEYDRHGGGANDAGPGQEPDGQQAFGTGPRHASRRSSPGAPAFVSVPQPRSVRAKIVAVLMVPVISLMALWAFATVTTAQSVADVQQLKDVNATMLAPIGEFVSAVQAERTAAAVFLASPEAGREALTTTAERTDESIAGLRDSIARSSTDAAVLDPQLPDRIESLGQAADILPVFRQAVMNRDLSWLVTFDAYTTTIRDSFSVTSLLTQLEAPGVASDLRFALELSLAQEMIARENAALSSAHAAEVMTQSQYLAFVDATRAGEALLWSDIDDLRPGADDAYRAIVDGQPYQNLRSLEDQITEGSAGYTVVSAVADSEWNPAVDAVQQQLALGEARVSTIAAEEANLFGLEVLGSSGLAVILGLVGVVLALLVSVVIGRGLVVDLAGLHRSAMDLATRKLPETLRKLHSGDSVDLESEAPVTSHGGDEVSQVAEALEVVHRAAVQAAIERSDVLRGISGVYVFLARRSQVLLHQQLALLDSMERRIDDPDQLEDLFRLDHLTTRMRRLTESLVILSGIQPARRWSNPVPVIDIVRGAVSEVEDFTRVEVTPLPDVRIDGSAVADLTHLIAELAENAVVFSPPQTKAVVRGEMVGTGLVLEIEDRGLGMSPEAMAEANRRVRGAEQVDLLETDQLGLFVVSRLARRGDIEVTLKRSSYGGVTAVVLVPEALLDRSPALEAAVSVHQLQHSTAGWSVSTSTELAAAAPYPPAPGPVGHPIPEPTPTTSYMRTFPAQESTTRAYPTQTASGPVPDLSGLPRRVRQSNIVPELRQPLGQRVETDRQPVGLRTPEEARMVQSALRSGWLRGQSEISDDSAQPGENR